MLQGLFLKNFLCTAGLLKDYTRRYDIAFTIGGAMIIIAAFFHIAIAFVKSDRDVESSNDNREDKIKETNKLDA